MEEAAERVSERDCEILSSLRMCRYLTTDHIRRLHFRESVKEASALRAASRVLAKLKGYGLVATLERQIGGVRGGSGSYVWTLLDGGLSVLAMREGLPSTTTRKRFFEPSPKFLNHTLAISEVYVKLTEIENIEVIKVLLEPDCWRGYKINSKAETLKPDMFAVTASGEYEDHWFIEVDLDTESPSRIITKCRQYIQYYWSGAEQKHSGVFPFVVWIVPDDKRRDTIQWHMEAELKNCPQIFRVISTEAFTALVQNGGA